MVKFARSWLLAASLYHPTPLLCFLSVCSLLMNHNPYCTASMQTYLRGDLLPGNFDYLVMKWYKCMHVYPSGSSPFLAVPSLSQLNIFSLTWALLKMSFPPYFLSHHLLSFRLPTPSPPPSQPLLITLLSLMSNFINHLTL